MTSHNPKRCLGCAKDIPDSRKRCWRCSYRKQAEDSARRSKAKRARHRMARNEQVSA